ncbi:MAG: hypothetical protein CSA51_04135 [Gammaproteobacteria bacterium]|nr:MAG: hypothetical protein CSA51_04135 [Gammaproteobacteria bacterium]
MQTLPTANDSISVIGFSLPKRYLRLSIPLILTLVFLLDPSVRPAFYAALADAYIAVGVFVALTLAAYYWAERRLGFNAEVMAAQSPLRQVLIASLLGVLPGCGGAIIVVSQYAAGHAGFAALVAVLVSTMGDAAFLLLAKAPQTGILVMATGLVVGIFSGWLVSVIHTPDFLNVKRQTAAQINCQPLPPYSKRLSRTWLMILLLAVPFSLLSSFQIDIAPLPLLNQSIDLTITVGVVGALLCIVLWALLPLQAPYQGLVAEDQVAHYSNDNSSLPADNTDNKTALSRVMHDTNFIMVWVTLAFLSFELFVHYTGLDIAQLFAATAWAAPLIGVLVGFLPGCGPQIIVASLYLQGVAPLSTLLGNAISNDGDALFPAIALAPKAAVMATIYSAVPALIVGYAVFFIAG